MIARIHVTLKKSVLDPQGKAVSSALGSLGFAGVSDVRIGKYFELKLEGIGRAEAERQVDAMCRQLLANTVIEEYRFELAD